MRLVAAGKVRRVTNEGEGSPHKVVVEDMNTALFLVILIPEDMARTTYQGIAVGQYIMVDTNAMTFVPYAAKGGEMAVRIEVPITDTTQLTLFGGHE
jgi:hypothetical protein